MNSYKFAAVFALAFSLASVAHAQPGGPGTISTVSSYVVQSGHTGDFEAEIKAYNAILVKAGASHGYTNWSSLSGDRPEYVRVDNWPKWGDLDHAGVQDDPKLKAYAADLALIGLRINALTLTNRRTFYRVREDLSLPPPKEMPKMIEVLRVTVDPHKIDEYVALKKEYLGLEKQAGLKMAEVMKGVFGTSVWEFVTVTGLDSWTNLDGPNPFTEAVGADALRKFNFGVLQTSRQEDVYRFRPELSYSPKAAAAQ